MLSHKETKEDELFEGNIIVAMFQKELFELNGINYRLGNVAFDIHGKIIKNGMKPLFIKKDSHETYDKLMRKLSGFTTDTEGILLV